MMRLRIIAVGALAVGALVSIGAGCRERERDEATHVVDVELMAYLSEARALHHQANLKEEANDLSGATAAMQKLVEARRPNGGKAPEVDEILADAYARLAELELRQGTLDPAADAIRTGLAHAREPTYFRGHLIEVQGLVEETRARVLTDAGRPEDAARARERAMELLEAVVGIQDQVIRSSLATREAGAARGTR